MLRAQRRPTILLADSDLVLVRAITRRLKEFRIDVQVVHDGKRLMQRLETFQPDLLVLALILPKIDGLEVLRTIRKTSRGKELPVIVLSTLRGLQDESDANKLGAKQFIVKSQQFLSDIVRKIAHEVRVVTH